MDIKLDVENEEPLGSESTPTQKLVLVVLLLVIFLVMTSIPLGKKKST